jgi:hypothetical protein
MGQIVTFAYQIKTPADSLGIAYTQFRIRYFQLASPEILAFDRSTAVIAEPLRSADKTALITGAFKSTVEAVDNKVLYLKRISMGNMTLPKDLEKGAFVEVEKSFVQNA